MNGLNISYSNVTKYLGCYLDTRLSFRHHINQKISAAKKLAMKIKNAIGSLWGPSPKALKWAYNGIIIPTISHGCVVWSRVCKLVAVKSQLQKLKIELWLCP